MIIIVGLITVLYADDRFLGMNPIQCDCDLRWLVPFRDMNTNLFTGGVRGTCREPANLNGSLLEHITEDQLVCSE